MLISHKITMFLHFIKKKESFKGGDDMRTVSSRMSRNAIEHPSLSPVREEGSLPEYQVKLHSSLLNYCNSVMQIASLIFLSLLVRFNR